MIPPPPPPPPRSRRSRPDDRKTELGPLADDDDYHRLYFSRGQDRRSAFVVSGRVDRAAFVLRFSGCASLPGDDDIFGRQRGRDEDHQAAVVDHESAGRESAQSFQLLHQLLHLAVPVDQFVGLVATGRLDPRQGARPHPRFDPSKDLSAMVGSGRVGMG